jgi:hypothetical protein
MHRRTEILKELVRFTRPAEPLWRELSSFGWDCDDESIHLVFKKEDLVAVLDRFLVGDISPKELEDWAEGLECRDDITFAEKESEMMRDMLFRISSPAITKALTIQSVTQMKYELTTERG